MTPDTTSEWISPRQLATEIGVAPVTLQTWRSQGRGPAFTRVGRQIRYARPAIAEWLTSRTTTPGQAA
jgi:predicted DNA-binding transcriptional regulator AlpA